MITRGKRTVDMGGGKQYTLDLDRANCPEARLALYRNDHYGDPLALIRFLDMTLGMEQLNRLMEDIRQPDGTPGTDAALMATVTEMFKKLGDDGKKS